MAKVTIAAANPVRPAPGSALAAEGFSGTLNAPTDSWEIANNGRIYLRVRNDHASQTGTLTIKTPQTVDGNAVADRTHTLAASRTSVLFGPFPSANLRRHARGFGDEPGHVEDSGRPSSDVCRRRCHPPRPTRPAAPGSQRDLTWPGCVASAAEGRRRCSPHAERDRLALNSRRAAARRAAAKLCAECSAPALAWGRCERHLRPIAVARLAERRRRQRDE